MARFPCGVHCHGPHCRAHGGSGSEANVGQMSAESRAAGAAAATMTAVPQAAAGPASDATDLDVLRVRLSSANWTRRNRAQSVWCKSAEFESQ